MINQDQFTVRTSGRNFYDITNRINALISDYKMNKGLCNLFLPHTSAGLILCENYDPKVREDLENFFSKLVPDGTHYQHHAEGPDDMPAHIRSILTHSDLTIPIVGGELDLGSWQGVYLWEHRTNAFSRSVLVTLIGEV